MSATPTLAPLIAAGVDAARRAAGDPSVWKTEVLPVAYQIADGVKRGAAPASLKEAATDLIHAAAIIERTGALPAGGYRTPLPETVRTAAPSVTGLIGSAARSVFAGRGTATTAAPVIKPSTVPSFLTRTKVPYAQPADIENFSAQAGWKVLTMQAAALNRLKDAGLEEFEGTGTVSERTRAAIAVGEQRYNDALALFKPYTTVFGGNATTAAIRAREKDQVARIRASQAAADARRKEVESLIKAPSALPPEPAPGTPALVEWNALSEQREALLTQKQGFQAAFEANLNIVPAGADDIRTAEGAYNTAIAAYKKKYVSFLGANRSQAVANAATAAAEKAARNAATAAEKQARAVAEGRFNESFPEKIPKPLTPGTPRSKYIELIEPAKEALLEAYMRGAEDAELEPLKAAYTRAVDQFKREGTYQSTLNYARGITTERRVDLNAAAQRVRVIDASIKGAGITKPSPPLRIFTKAVAAYAPVQEAYAAYAAAYGTDDVADALAAYGRAVETYNQRAEVAASELKKEVDAFAGISVPWRPVFPSFRTFYNANLAPDSAKYRAVVETYNAKLSAMAAAPDGDVDAATAAYEAARTAYEQALADYTAITDKNRAEKEYQKEAEAAIEKPVRKPTFPAARRVYTENRIDELYDTVIREFVSARKAGIRDPLAPLGNGRESPTKQAKDAYDAALAIVKTRLDYASTANYLRNIPRERRTELNAAAAAAKAAKAAEEARKQAAKAAFSYVEPTPRGPHPDEVVEMFRKDLERTYVGLLRQQQTAQANATTRATYKTDADRYASDLTKYKAFAKKPDDAKYADLRTEIQVKERKRLIDKVIADIGDGSERAASHPNTALYPAREAYLRAQLASQPPAALQSFAGEYAAENAATKGPARRAVLNYIRDESHVNLQQGVNAAFNRALNTLARSRFEFQKGGRKTRRGRRMGRKTRRSN